MGKPMDSSRSRRPRMEQRSIRPSIRPRAAWTFSQRTAEILPWESNRPPVCGQAVRPLAGVVELGAEIRGLVDLYRELFQGGAGLKRYIPVLLRWVFIAFRLQHF